MAALVAEARARRWLSTNPDSVDGLPSLHLNLVSGGEEAAAVATLGGCVADMVDALRPHLYDDLLPAVRALTGRPGAEIADVFLRSYGAAAADDAGDEDAAAEDAPASRLGLSAHYDVTACATCVIALDATAAAGRSGLYVVPAPPPPEEEEGEGRAAPAAAAARAAAPPSTPRDAGSSPWPPATASCTRATSSTGWTWTRPPGGRGRR